MKIDGSVFSAHFFFFSPLTTSREQDVTLASPSWLLSLLTVCLELCRNMVYFICSVIVLSLFLCPLSSCCCLRLSLLVWVTTTTGQLGEKGEQTLHGGLGGSSLGFCFKAIMTGNRKRAVLLVTVDLGNEIKMTVMSLLIISLSLLVSSVYHFPVALMLSLRHN